MSFFRTLFKRTGDDLSPAAIEPSPDAAGPEPDPGTAAPPAVPPVGEQSVDQIEIPSFEPAAETGWFRRLTDGLSKSSRALSSGITDIFTKRRLNDATLAELEDLLIGADLGLDMASRITAAVAQGRYDREVSPDEVRGVMADQISAVLKPVEVPFVFDPSKKPFVILVVGVNGTGKTTTIGKLGRLARREGLSVMLAACDTFRAAAIEQLEQWGSRIGAEVIARKPGSDAAGVAFDALIAARERQNDILIIDTAGRLHNKAHLMAELEKVIRVLKKQDAVLPHATLLVLDATTGQNALTQVEMFLKTAGVTGIVMTKLDGTARGGILVAIAERFALPVHAIGVGERPEDLQPFDAQAFAKAIAGFDLEEKVS
jgi:fused signal recognition particle receptor